MLLRSKIINKLIPTGTEICHFIFKCRTVSQMQAVCQVELQINWKEMLLTNVSISYCFKAYYDNLF